MSGVKSGVVSFDIIQVCVCVCVCLMASKNLHLFKRRYLDPYKKPKISGSIILYRSIKVSKVNVYEKIIILIIVLRFFLFFF